MITTKPWKKGKKIETPLMGVVCKISDLDVMTKKLKSIESVGINLSQFNKPLLVKVKNELKSKDVWVHGISAPTTYPKSAGTLGILVNYYGIDSISSPVINWKSAQGFGGKIAKMTDDEHSQNALKNKYFKPTDYETPTIGALKTKFGEDQKLSEFCTCPVCNGLKIKDLLQKPQEVNDNSRSHRVVSFLNESAIYQNKLKNNGTDEYISSKPYAKKIIG